MSGSDLPDAIEVPDLTASDEAQGGERDKQWLIQPCPVVPLGIRGSRLFFIDSNYQLIDADTRCNKGDMTLWFGTGYLETHFPQWKENRGKDKANEPFLKDGFNQKTSSQALIEECRLKGPFNPQGRMFGRGAHRGREDEDLLVLHSGRKLLLANAPDKRGDRGGPPMAHPPGVMGEAFYPAAPALMPPAEQAAEVEEGERVHAILEEWLFQDKAASRLLLLGMIGQMFIPGALNWRAHVWLTGPTAAGKSLLQKLIRAILGDWCVESEDASEAGVRQRLGIDALAVLLDEQEPDESGERAKMMIHLARKSSSGSTIIRGSADHKAQEFTGRSAFLFSSILHSPLQGQDRNRIVIMPMEQIPDGKKEPKIDFAEWREIGRRLHRRVVDQWPRFDRTLQAYRTEIFRVGYAGRWQDTYGTLLAFADMLLNDAAPQDDDGNPDADWNRVEKRVNEVLPIMFKAKQEARTDIERCILHLMASLLPAAPGRHQETVGRWIHRAMEMRERLDHQDTEIDREARDKLRAHGLRVGRLHNNARPGEKPRMGFEEAGVISSSAREEDRPGLYADNMLFIAGATSRPLSDLFRATEWNGGGWLQSLGKIEGAVRGVKCRFAGRPENALAVPLRVLFGEGEG